MLESKPTMQMQDNRVKSDREEYSGREPLEVQRGTEDNRIGSSEHFRCPVEFFLKFCVADNLGSLTHLSDKFLKSSENTDE